MYSKPSLGSFFVLNAAEGARGYRVNGKQPSKGQAMVLSTECALSCHPKDLRTGSAVKHCHLQKGGEETPGPGEQTQETRGR